MSARLEQVDLAAVLRDMAAAVEAGDSMEGNISYEPDEDEAFVYRVRAVYRIGNSMGQGGVRIIDEVPADEVPV